MKKIFLLSALNVSVCSYCNSQIFSAGVDTTIYCGDSLTLTAGNGITSTIYSATDDGFSGVINMGFNFDFYGNPYTQCVIGSNGIISFNLVNANLLCPFFIATALPSTSNTAAQNAILFPWHDMYPPFGGTTSYSTIGTAPDRIFSVEFCLVPMVNCTTLKYTGQVLLYETSNIIETHIYNKPLCSAWNNGRAIHGVENNGGTIANIVPGRNSPTQWSTTNDGKRFTPNGLGAYTISTIPFSSVPLTLNTYSWYENGTTLIGNNQSVTVAPTSQTFYVARAQTCNGTIVRDTINVNIASPVNSGATVTPVDCFGDSSGMISLSPSGGHPPFQFQWSTGNSTSGISNLSPGNFYCTITDSIGCYRIDTFVVTQPLPLSANLSSSPTDASCIGIATSAPNGGTPPYNYQWSNSGTTSIINNLCSGWYYVTITDANDCTRFDSVFVSSNTGVENANAPEIFYISPNPATKEVMLRFTIEGRYNVQLCNMVGEVLGQTQINSEAISLNISSYPGGIYFVTVTDENKNSITKKMVKM